MQGDAFVGQGAAHDGIALDGLRLVIVVGENRLHPKAVRQASDLVARHGVPHDQASVRRAGERAQSLVQLHQRFPDELHPAIGAWQRIQDVAVEHEYGVDLPAVFQRVVKRRVVPHAQVAPEPHQSLVKWLVADHR